MILNEAGADFIQTPKPHECERFQFKTTRCAQEKINRWNEHMPSKEPASVPIVFNNDPSAGSPTETLLRLLLPLNDQV